MTYWWLSFVDEAQRSSERFLGVCIVEVDDDGDINDAAIEARTHGCNPGGQVAGLVIRPEYLSRCPFIENMNRLLTEQEARSLFEAQPLAELKGYTH